MTSIKDLNGLPLLSLQGCEASLHSSLVLALLSLQGCEASLHSSLVLLLLSLQGCEASLHSSNFSSLLSKLECQLLYTRIIICQFYDILWCSASISRAAKILRVDTKSYPGCCLDPFHQHSGSQVKGAGPTSYSDFLNLSSTPRTFQSFSCHKTANLPPPST